GCLGARDGAPPLGKLFRHGVLVKTHPRLLWEGNYLPGPAAPGSRPWRQRGHQDCIAAILDALLIPAGQVGMIMAVFVPTSGYKRSKNPSGRPDLNRRPLDPQSRSGRRWTWLSVAQWALDQA